MLFLFFIFFYSLYCLLLYTKSCLLSPVLDNITIEKQLISRYNEVGAQDFRHSPCIISEKKEMGDMEQDYLTLTIGKQKNIALIAHDGKKAELIQWCKDNFTILSRHFLCGTGTTARMITDATGLPVRGYNSGPLGGDQQIGAKIVEGKIDFVIFFSDPLTAAPHDPDVKALLRIAQVYDIPMANNKATADFLIHSALMDEVYNHKIVNFNKNIADRASTLPGSQK